MFSNFTIGKVFISPSVLIVSTRIAFLIKSSLTRHYLWTAAFKHMQIACNTMFSFDKIAIFIKKRNNLRVSKENSFCCLFWMLKQFIWYKMERSRLWRPFPSVLSCWIFHWLSSFHSLLHFPDCQVSHCVRSLLEACAVELSIPVAFFFFYTIR